MISSKLFFFCFHLISFDGSAPTSSIIPFVIYGDLSAGDFGDFDSKTDSNIIEYGKEISRDSDSSDNNGIGGSGSGSKDKII